MLLLHAASGSGVSPGRQSTSLDGTWQFKLVNPDASTQVGSILVPGSWEAQGYGNETTQMQGSPRRFLLRTLFFS